MHKIPKGGLGAYSPKKFFISGVPKMLFLAFSGRFIAAERTSLIGAAGSQKVNF